ncbi:MAG: hypothetical protein IPM18_06705 [Phycisphaerales bacterium]|nr:hypothetical protein [Phycisphaerales bacterium]
MRIDAARIVGLVGAVAFVAWYLVGLILRPDLTADETYHVPAILGLARGDWTEALKLPMPPTYHLVVAGVARVFGPDLWVLRLPNLIVAVAAIFVVDWVLRARWPQGDALGVALFACNPLLWPYVAFCYTEPLCLLGVLLAFGWHVRGRYLAAALALLVACLVRQSTMVWGLFFLGWALLEQLAPWAGLSRAAVGWGHGDTGGRTARTPSPPPPNWHQAVMATWPYMVLLELAAVYVLVVGFTQSHSVENALRPNRAQGYVLILTLGLLWFPRWVAALPGLWRVAGQPVLLRAAGCTALAGLVGLLALAFANPHPWNLDTYYLRNWPLAAMTRDGGMRWAFSAAVVLIGAALVVAARGAPYGRVLALAALCGAAYVGAHYLVDPRYYVLPIYVLELLWPRKGSQRETARTLVAWYVLLLIGLWLGLAWQPGGWGGIW